MDMVKKALKPADLAMVIALVCILGTLVIPIPPFFIDLLLVASICSAMLILMLTIQLKEPLELSAFPSLLLILTLFRLSVNVASTRQILLTGYAGHVIQAFGQFVVGGNLVVGTVIFLILVLINFKVIVAGSGRIAEVAARFTLDAMPGKQMSIDADLNAGLIDEKTAIDRRQRLSREADFFGAMDGASKFIRGDAVAGLIITAINIGGGFAIGMLQQKMTAIQSLKTYSLLTIGEGLVAQIPALVISTAAGMMVTRAASTDNLGTEVQKQLFSQPKPLLITGAVAALMALVPGLPFLPFIALGGTLFSVGWVMQNKPASAALASGKGADVAGLSFDRKGAAGMAPGGKPGEVLKDGQKSALPAAPTPAAFKQVLNVSPMDLEIGFGLVPLVDREKGGKLIERIGMIRSQIAEELGLVIPPVNVRDNVNLKNIEYSIKIRGLEVARDAVRPGHLLAINPGPEIQMEGGIPVREPAFGFQAFWIPENRRDLAESRGLTVVDCASVITTHVAEIVKKFAADILTRQMVNELVDNIKEQHAAVVQELIPTKMTVGGVHRVLQNLLRERVSIRDLPVILETLADHAGRTQDSNVLVEFCRRALGGHICREHLTPEGMINAIGIAPQLEDILRGSVRREANELGTLTLDPGIVHDILQKISSALEAAQRADRHAVLLCSPLIRMHLRQLVQHDFKDLPVISYAEVPDDVKVNMLAVVMPPEQPAASAVPRGEANEDTQL